jgi:hypothetical protein
LAKSVDKDSCDVFLSYSRADQAVVEGVAKRLHGLGLQVFLDRWYLAPGCSWPQALERALADCRSVAVALGPSGMGAWQQREQYHALDRQAHTPGFRVIPVVLPGTEDLALGFLGLNTWVDLRTNLDRGVELLAKAVRGEPAGGPDDGPDPRAAICPYRGLQPFREEDAAFFCGREAFTATLVERIASHSLIAVVGASGSGKSSVVRAGLVPALRRGADAGRIWDIVVLRPGREPIQALAAALLPPEPDLDEFDRMAVCRRRARQLASGDVPLPAVVERILERQPGTERVLLVVDQAEELFTLADTGARTRFIDLVLEACTSAPLSVVLTLRGDFYGRALECRPLADRLDQGVVNLGPMTSDELGRAIREPAEKVGLEFEDGLVERILADVGSEPGKLPLLEFLLEGLWQRRAQGRLAHSDYDTLGGVAGAIVTRADAEYRRLDPEQRQAARRFLVRLVAPGEGREDTRAVAEVPKGDPLLTAVVRQFANARLLVTDRNDAGAGELVEVSHEALIRSWTELRRWVDEDREFLRTLRRAKEAKAVWSAEGRSADRLLQPGRPLGEAEELLERRPDFVDPDLLAFISASQRRARRTAQLRGLVAVGALALAVVASITAWEAKQSRGDAERHRLVAEENRRLAEQRAEGLAVALTEAQANLIWSNLELNADPLTPEEVDALWKVGTVDESVRKAFLRQLGENRSSVLKFARNPAPLLRALGLRLSSEDAQALLDPLLAALDDGADPTTLRNLAKAIRAIPAQPTAEQARQALATVMVAFSMTRDPYALQALAEAAQALPLQLSGEQAQTALAPILNSLQRNTEPEALQALVLAVQALAPYLEPTQAKAMTGPILAALKTTTRPQAVGPLVQAARTLDPVIEIDSLPGGLGLARAGLAGARSSTEAIAWATALDAVLPHADSSIGTLVDALKYPTAALRSTQPLGSNPVSAESYLLGELDGHAGLKELRFTGMKDILAWVAAHHPEIDLTAPPLRPAPMDQLNVANRKLEP